MSAKPKLSVRTQMCIATAMRRWGSGWARLTPEMRQGLVCRELIYMALGQHQETCEQNPGAVLKTLLADFRDGVSVEEDKL